MSGSGLIYALIVAVWACVLVPRWVRRPDEEAEAAHDVDAVDASGGSAAAAVRLVPRRWVDRSERSAPADQAARSDEPTPVDAQRRMLARRRRTLVVLFAWTVIAAAVAAVGAGPWWSVAGPGLLLMLYLGRLRAQARAASRARRQAGDVQARAGHVQPLGPPPAPAVDRAGPTAQDEPAAIREPGEPGELAAPVEAFDRAEPAVDAGPAGPSWDPVHIPPPTYVTAPAAPSPARSIDLSRPGFWTEGWRVAADSVDPVEAAEPDEPAGAGEGSGPDDEGRPRDHRRAVND